MAGKEEALRKEIDRIRKQNRRLKNMLEVTVNKINLIRKNDRLFAVDAAGNFIGEIINEVSGRCVSNPTNDNPGTFARVFEGHGYIYHQDDNPPNPFFVQSWGQVFSNPELLPVGTKNVFVDQGRDAKDNFNAKLIG